MTKATARKIRISSIVNTLLLIFFTALPASTVHSQSKKVAELKIATFNTFLRSGGIFTNKHDTYRANRIAEYFVRKDYDIIALQEMWDDDIDVIIDTLSDRGYHSAYNRKTGLYIASKQPIVFSTTKLFNNEAGDENSVWSWLGNVDKGFMTSLIFIGGVPIYIITTHMQSENYNSVRLDQAQQIENFIGGLQKTRPIIMLGDFNVEYGTSHYRDIMSNFTGFSKSDPNNAVTLICDSEIYPGCSNDNNKKVKIDYILTKDGETSNNSRNYSITSSGFSRIVMTHSEPERKVGYLSDHALLETTINIYLNEPDKTPAITCTGGKVYSEKLNACIPKPVTCTPCPTKSKCQKHFLKYDKTTATNIWSKCSLVGCSPGFEIKIDNFCNKQCQPSVISKCFDSLNTLTKNLPREVAETMASTCTQLSRTNQQLQTSKMLNCQLRDKLSNR